MQVPALREQVRAFLEEQRRLGSYEPVCDAWLQGNSPAFSRLLAQQGWVGMAWPPAYGGHDRSAVERFVVVEELLAAGAPVAAHWVSDRQIGPSILHHGTEQQRRRFLPAIARAETFFCIGMSEPDSGSDLASVRTKAERDDAGRWRVSGRKVWTSHAHHSHYMLALVRTSPAEGDRHHGLSQLILDLSAPGVDVRPIEVMTGQAHFAEVTLDDVVVDDSMLLGAVGQGWKQAMAELSFERSGPERFLSTFPLLQSLVAMTAAGADVGSLERIGEVSARLLALHALTFELAQLLDSGHSPAVQAAVTKDLGTQLERDIVEIARAVEPASSVTDDDEYQRLLAQAMLSMPAFTLRGGTTEILRGIVARSVGQP